MRKIGTGVATLLLCNMFALAQSTKTQDGIAARLFENVKSNTSAGERNLIAQKLGFILSGNKDLPFALDKDSKDYPFATMVMPTDLNKDSKEEIFVSYGNSFTSGNTGASIVLFIKNAAGIYEMNLGFPGLTPDILTTSNKSYPDLLIGGPGFDFPVLRWNGKKYDNYKTVKDSEYEKLKKTGADVVSKEYQKTLK